MSLIRSVNSQEPQETLQADRREMRTLTPTHLICLPHYSQLQPGLLIFSSFMVPWAPTRSLNCSQLLSALLCRTGMPLIYFYRLW